MATEIDNRREEMMCFFILRPLVIFSSSVLLLLSGLQKEHSLSIEWFCIRPQWNVFVVIFNSLQEQMHRSSLWGEEKKSRDHSFKTPLPFSVL